MQLGVVIDVTVWLTCPYTSIKRVRDRKNLNETKRRNQEPIDTNRRCNNKEEKADGQGTGGQRTQHKPLGTGRGLGCRSMPARGGVDMRATEEGRGREGPLEEKTHRG